MIAVILVLAMLKRKVMLQVDCGRLLLLLLSALQCRAARLEFLGLASDVISTGSRRRSGTVLPAGDGDTIVDGGGDTISGAIDFRLTCRRRLFDASAYTQHHSVVIWPTRCAAIAVIFALCV